MRLARLHSVVLLSLSVAFTGTVAMAADPPGAAPSVGVDDALRKGIVQVESNGRPLALGAPILEPNGRVVGVVVRACKDSGAAPDAGAAAPTPCVPQIIAAPVYALRSFVMATPKTAAIPAPWLGLGGAPSEAGNVRGVK